MNWKKVLFWLWAVGSVLWATFTGLLLPNNRGLLLPNISAEEIQIVALGPPLVILAIAALVWAFRVFWQ
jgi:hypothetical protein